MKRKIAALAVLLALVLTGCRPAPPPQSEYTKYTNSFFDAFDTVTQVVAYTRTEAEFDAYYEQIHARFRELHQLYDIYNVYPGQNNLKTINDNAGIKPVPVDQEIIDLLLFAKEWYERTGGQTNIAMGAVLRIWHDYRTEGIDEPQNAKLPPLADLQAAADHTDLDQVIIDPAAGTVYLQDPRMSLDVGALAKGYATEKVAQEITAAGLTSGIISAGGNVRVLGKPLDNVRERWSIGIQDPDQSILSDTQSVLDTVYVTDLSVVSSGDYQRYYIVDGQLIHHLIDPVTLFPGAYFRAVTVVTRDSGLADFLSTALFLQPLPAAKALAASIEGVEALWVLPDGTVEVTEGLKPKLKSFGATAQ